MIGRPGEVVSLPRREPPRVLVVSGPNLQLLGHREPEIYGTTTLEDIHARLAEVARGHGASIVARQSNSEGELVTWIGEAARDGFHGALVNPGAYTHTSIALFDAAKACGLPLVEVHLSNPDAREAFRRRSFVARAAVARVAGFGWRSYELGLLGLLAHLGRGAPRARARAKVAVLKKPR